MSDERQNRSRKVTADHLKRKAYLYVRQSTPQQVREHTESTERQYALRHRAVELGWQSDQVVVIDEDQGRSAASDAGRGGFKGLVADVGMGLAGVVMGIEVSRLARNNADWHRLLEICALSDTLILDEEGLYEPGHFNDRLLLGLKGTMSEAELHMLRARMRGGVLNKARKGELEMPLPVGFVYDSTGGVALDPDQQVRDAVNLLFDTFGRVGSAFQTVRYFRQQGLRFPRRWKGGAEKGELAWTLLSHQRTLQVLRNPRYAGAFAFGKRRSRKTADGRTTQLSVDRDEWLALIPNAHEGYISWDNYEENLRLLLRNRPGQRHGPPREGPALLQGLVVCGRCGGSMTISYRMRCAQQYPMYVCNLRHWKVGEKNCQSIPGGAIDDAVGKVLVDAFKPVAIDAAIAVQDELQARLDEADRLRHRQVERAQYEVDLARRRYMQVDPDNRLVADALEGEWNAKIRALAGAQDEYERQRKQDRVVFDQETKARVRALAEDFGRVWNDPSTPERERKRMARLVIEDATLTYGEEITIGLRFKTGATHTITLPRPPRIATQTPPDVVSEVDALLDQHTPRRIAELLNERGFQSGTGKSFSAAQVCHIRRSYKLRTRMQRLVQRGFLTERQVAQKLSTTPSTVARHRRAGTLPFRAHQADDLGPYVYEPLGGQEATLPPGTRHTPPAVLAEIERLLDHHAPGRVAEILNEKGLLTATKKPFTAKTIGAMCYEHELRTHMERLRSRGLLTTGEVAGRLSVNPATVDRRRKAGTLPFRAHRLADRGRFMYEDAQPIHEMHTSVRA